MAQVTMITTGQLATDHSPTAHKRNSPTKKVYNKKIVVDWSVRNNKEINKSGTTYYSSHNSVHKSNRRTQNNNENSGSKMNSKLNHHPIIRNPLHNSKSGIENICYDNNNSYEDFIDKSGKYLMKNAQNHYRPCGRNQKMYFESYQRVQSTDCQNVFGHGSREKYELSPYRLGDLRSSASLGQEKQSLRKTASTQQQIKPNISLKICDDVRSIGGPISYSDIAKKHSQIAPNTRHKNLDMELNSDIPLNKNDNGSKGNICTQYATGKRILTTNPNENKMDGMTINDESGFKDQTVKSIDLSTLKPNASSNYDIGCNVDSDPKRESNDDERGTKLNTVVAKETDLIEHDLESKLVSNQSPPFNDLKNTGQDKEKKLHRSSKNDNNMASQTTESKSSGTSQVAFPYMQRGQLFINPAVLLQTDRNSANKHTHPVDQQAFSTASSITANSRDNMDPALQGDFKNMTITTKPKVGGYGEMSEKYQINNGVIPQIEIPDEKDLRYCVLSFEQVKRLNDLMSENIPIHGRGNFPTIDVKLCDLVSIVRTKLEADGIHVREIRLNGSGASSVLAADFNDTHNNDISYNDLDLIFSVDLATGKAYDRVKTAVLDSLLELLPPGVSRKRMSSCSLKEAYVSKMVKVNDTDRWSLITLGNNRAKTIELKFVNNMKRQYEFSVDSFHIMLDTLFLFYECSSRCSVNGDKPKSPSSMSIGDNFYPTVVGESMYGDFHEALYHLQKKLISTKNPEEIRGGGLLKYCNLLCKGYRPAIPEEVKNMERYMCSRFFIDFSDINQQQSKLENYLYNHFVVEGNYPENDQLKYEYLMILYQVVDESTVCLMGHERRLTLALIEDMAFQVYNPPYYPIPPPEYPTNHNLNGKPEKDNTTEIFNAESLASSSVCDQSSSSAASTCSSMSTGGSSMSSSASSTSSSGTTTPQKPPTPGPVIQTMMAPAPQYVNNQLQTTVYQQIHRHTHNHPPPMTAQYMTNVPPPTTGLPAVALTNQPTTSVHQYVPSTQISTAGQQQISTTNCNTVTIPTYEIVTSCQPAVIYSGGYYYTSFMSPSNQGTSVAITDTSSPPPQISGQLPTTATVQQLPTQQVNVGSQQPSSALPCTCTCSCNQWPALAAENQTSAVHMVPAVPPPSTHQHVSAPPPCCITQPIVCT